MNFTQQYRHDRERGVPEAEARKRVHVSLSTRLGWADFRLLEDAVWEQVDAVEREVSEPESAA